MRLPVRHGAPRDDRGAEPDFCLIMAVSTKTKTMAAIALVLMVRPCGAFASTTRVRLTGLERGIAALAHTQGVIQIGAENVRGKSGFAWP